MVDDCVPEPEIDGEINWPEESTETNQSFVFANVSPDAERVIVALPEPSVVAVRYLWTSSDISLNDCGRCTGRLNKRLFVFVSLSTA